jgi:hypothetical protein
MVHRAADYYTAQEVFVAVELARRGAASALIERLTGFGARWVRSIVREHGGALAMKSKDPLRWFEENPTRLLHARYVQMAYERQPANETMGRRLLNTYNAYRRVAAIPGLLGINECAQVIDLYQSGNAWVRECTECQQKHLVLTERTLCPVCRLMAREFCRGCGQPLPASVGRLRAYCDTCSPRSVRLAIRRRGRRVQGTVVPDPSASSPTSLQSDEPAVRH